MAKPRLLLVDDEAVVRVGFRRVLEASGFEVTEVGTLAAALEALRFAPPDAALVDYRLPDGTALELLKGLKAHASQVPVVMLTGYGSIDLAVQAIKEGAENFLTKPVEPAALVGVFRRILSTQRYRHQKAERSAHDPRADVDPFLGESPAIRRLEEAARRVLDSDSPVLIRGETGTGKGVLASWIHRHGARAAEPFVDLNCAGLSREFLDTELFGHEKGAFTGAAASKQGLFEAAHRGTLFLDELGDMDLAVQPKLLKVLEEKRFRRLGDVKDRHADVRLVAATHQDLAALVQAKSFRSDLYFRVSTLPLAIPPLRERPEDIPILTRVLLGRIAGELRREPLVVLPGAEAALKAFPWPGNVRELRNVLERAVLQAERPALAKADIRFDAPEPARPPSSELTLAEVERRHIVLVLEEEKGRVESAAKRLGVPRSSLYEKLRRLGLATGRR